MPTLSGYHPRVRDFGRRVRAVREAGELQQMQIARAVTTTERAAKSFSNYLSRIERGDEENPSLDKIESIARGMGLTLSAFFLAIERSQNQALHSRNDVTKIAAPHRSGEAAAHGDPDPISAASEQHDIATLRETFRQLEADLRRLEARDRQRAAARGHKTQTRKTDRTTRTKAS